MKELFLGNQKTHEDRGKGELATNKLVPILTTRFVSVSESESKNNERAS